MRNAIARYKELCGMAEAYTTEPPDPWQSISELIKYEGAKESWTSDKVKYAWHHGASTLFPEIYIVCPIDW